MPSKIPDGETRGWIVPIGGAENKENDRQILERFVRVSGGSDANIVVIPTASRIHETGPRYEQLFKDLGAAEVAVMDFDTRRDCQEPGRLRRLEQASGIFFTGNIAGEAHPVIAEGISMAIQSSGLLARLLIAHRQDDYAQAWTRRFASRIRAASLFAHLAMSDAGRAASLAVLRAVPGLIGHGARWSGKMPISA